VERLDAIRYRKWVWVTGVGGAGSFNTRNAPADYRQAFAERGLDLAALEPTEAARRLAEAGVKSELVAAVDDWALHEPNERIRDKLLAIARKADPGPWTDRLRDPAVRRDRTAVAKLAADADPVTTSPTSLSVLAVLMWSHGMNSTALLSAARVRHPTDFELAYVLGLRHAETNDARAIGLYQTACALRPENPAVWNNLGVALIEQRDVDGAIASFKEVLRIDPKFVLAHTNLGIALKQRRDLDGAIASFKQAIAHEPKFATAHHHLAMTLHDKGDVEGAIASYREAIKHEPSNASTHNNLGAALMTKGDADGAIAAFKEAIRHNPRYANAHYNLGLALKNMNDLEGAIASYREAIKHEPRNVNAHYNLGLALMERGDADGAIAAYKEALRLAPKDAFAQTNLGVVYFKQQKYAEAITCARAAIGFNPKLANAHALLGQALSRTGDVPGAQAALAEAVRLDPKRFGPLLAKPSSFEVGPPPREVKRP
jgi:tetratricopeptide (TPR) repeat protein